jgi:hypothetical protein
LAENRRPSFREGDQVDVSSSERDRLREALIDLASDYLELLVPAERIRRGNESV